MAGAAAGPVAAADPVVAADPGAGGPFFGAGWRSQAIRNSSGSRRTPYCRGLRAIAQTRDHQMRDRRAVALVTDERPRLDDPETLALEHPLDVERLARREHRDEVAHHRRQRLRAVLGEDH